MIIKNLHIVAPALKSIKTGKVFKGNAGDLHANIYERIIRKIAALYGISDVDSIFDMLDEKLFTRFESGFIDNLGNYYNRQEAYSLKKGKPNAEGLLYAQDL